MSDAGGGLRAIRGSVVAACCLAPSLLAHALAGGGTPPVPVVASLALALAAVCTWVSARRWHFASLLIVLLAAQAALHPIFAATSTTSSTAGAPLESAMAIAHLLAAVAVALVLSRGEDLLHAWLAVLCRTHLVRLPAAPVAIDRDPDTLPPAPSRRRPKVLASGAAARRGPPVSGTVRLLPS